MDDLYIALLVLLATAVPLTLGILAARRLTDDDTKVTHTPSLSSRIMSRILGSAGPIETSDIGECHQVTTAGDVIAMPSPDVTELVTGDAGDSVPSDARAIIYHEARAQAIADLLRAGLLTNQGKAIEAVYHCPRASASRPESPYQKAKARIDALTQTRPQFPQPLTPEQKEVRQELGLETLP